ncbi:MAG: leucine-rich repeat domain-containing protein [Treponema sp.]|nr:leucine-rich repeat domain-containing protein [Treponema sp.]
MNMKTVFLFTLMMLFCLTACVQKDSSYDDFEIALVGSTRSVHITGYTGSKNVVRIPSHIHGVTVTTIEGMAIAGCSIRSVNLPHTITLIGSSAFTGCRNLTKVTFARSDTTIDSIDAFPGDLHEKYASGGAGTYTRSRRQEVWKKR